MQRNVEVHSLAGVPVSRDLFASSEIPDVDTVAASVTQVPTKSYKIGRDFEAGTGNVEMGHAPFNPTQGYSESMGIPQKEFETLRRNAARSVGTFPESELLIRALQLRNSTEGNIPQFYNDAGGIAIGMGLNLSVQDEKSLRNLVGGDEKLYSKLKPYLGKKFRDLSPEDIKNSQLTPSELKALNGYLVAASLESVAPYKGNLTPTGQMILSDIQHYTGGKGLRSAKSKIGVNENGRNVNHVADVILTGSATDAELRDAILRTIQNPSVNAVTKARFKKYLKDL